MGRKAILTEVDAQEIYEPMPNMYHGFLLMLTLKYSECIRVVLSIGGNDFDDAESN